MDVPSWAQPAAQPAAPTAATAQSSQPGGQGGAPSNLPSWAQPKPSHVAVAVSAAPNPVSAAGSAPNPFTANPFATAASNPPPAATAPAATAPPTTLAVSDPRGEARSTGKAGWRLFKRAEPKEPKVAAAPKAAAGPDRCFNVPPCQGFGASVAIALALDIIGGYCVHLGKFTAAGILLSFSATGWIAAFAFLFGPRKYFKNALFKNPLRTISSLTYWSLIVLTVALCFTPDVSWRVIVLVIVLQKLAWAFNLAVVCGCVKWCGNDADDANKDRGSRI